MKRGVVTKGEAEMVTFWLPTNMVAALQQAILIEDTDRSKFIRRAVRERLRRMRITTEAAQ